jgi:XTP/dITP diphosphohydrolase
MTDVPVSVQHPQLDGLIAVLEHLRAPGGCAWDAEQTHGSLVQYLVEETYELVDAIETGTREDLIEELGDVLYQVIFHSDIAANTPGEEFTIEDVAANMTAKMVGRHPHVFGNSDAKTASEVVDLWEVQKTIEKPHRTSVLDGIPQRMPSLALADKLIGRAQRVGFAPLAVPAQAVPAPADEAELGAVLLATVVAARAKGLDSERALRVALRGLQDEIRVAEQLRE